MSSSSSYVNVLQTRKIHAHCMSNDSECWSAIAYDQHTNILIAAANTQLYLHEIVSSSSSRTTATNNICINDDEDVDVDISDEDCDSIDSEQDDDDDDDERNELSIEFVANSDELSAMWNPISEVAVLSTYDCDERKGILVVRSNHNIALFDYLSLRTLPMTILPLPKENVRFICADENRLIIFVSLRIIVFDCVFATHQTSMTPSSRAHFTIIDEITLLDEVCMAHFKHGVIVCGTRNSYMLIHAQKPICVCTLNVPIQGSPPCCLIVNNNQLLLSTNTQLGIFANFQGHPLPMAPLAWSDNPISICCIGDYISALLPNSTIEVFSLYDQALLQTLSVDASVISLHSSVHSIAFILCNDAVFSLSCVSANKQIQQLVKYLRFDEAFSLFRRNLPSILDEEMFRIRLGVVLFECLLFADSFQHFTSLTNSELLQFYPGIVIKQSVEQCSRQSLCLETRVEQSRISVQKKALSARVPNLKRLKLSKVLTLSNNELVLEARLQLALCLWQRRLTQGPSACIDEALLQLTIFLEGHSLPFCSYELLADKHISFKLEEKFLLHLNDKESLVTLYEREGLIREALTQLHELSTQPPSFEKAIASTIRILSSINDTKIVFEFSASLCEKIPLKAITIFTRYHNTLPEVEVINFLADISMVMAIKYGEFAIFKLRNEHVELHNVLAHLYLTLMLENDDSISNVSSRFRRFIVDSVYYDAFMLLDSIPENKLYEERALLYDVLGNHDEVLKVYVYDVFNMDAAAKYCLSLHSDYPHIFTKLLSFLFHPNINRMHKLHSIESYQEAAIRLLSIYEDMIDSVSVLDLIPSHLPMSLLTSALSRLLSASVSRKRRGQIEHAMYRSHCVQIQIRLSRLQHQSLRMNEASRCEVCGDVIGDHIFTYMIANKQIMHCKCAKTNSASHLT